MCKKDDHFVNNSIQQIGKCIFTTNSQNKIKGSGIALFVNYKWVKHIGKIFNSNDYLLSVSFYFKQCCINIILVYVPPNNQVSTTEISHSLNNILTNNFKTTNTYTIVMGDLMQ
jgi:hypothetical protein